LSAKDISDPQCDSPACTVLVSEVTDKHILDTSGWNRLFDDPQREAMLAILDTKIILPTVVAISELAAIEDAERRINLLRLVKTLGKDNRPLASPNQLIIMACQGYARRDRFLTINSGTDAAGAWVAINNPSLVDEEAQHMALAFNAERENVLRESHESLRTALQIIFQNGFTRPRSMGALIRHYAANDDFLYGSVNPLYERAVGKPLPATELWPLIRSVPHWPMFLMAYGCAIYQRAVKEHGYGHKKNPGHLDLWSATYLPDCETFITDDRRQRRALKIINGANPRPAKIVSYDEWRDRLLS